MNSPKHISGISYVDNNVLKIVFNYSTAFGFDPLGNVEDITVGGDLPASVIYSNGKVEVRYTKFLLHTGGYKTFRVTFGSGYTTEIHVDYLPVHRQIPPDNTHIGLASDCSEDYTYVQTLSREGSPDITTTYGAVPVVDTANVFSYNDLWDKTAPETASFTGEYINSEWTAGGYPGGRPSGNSMGLQHVRYIAAVGTDPADLGFATGVELFADAQYNQSSVYAAVCGFDWALNLTSCEISSPFTYDVCIDSGSPAYFTVTELDCSSVAIPVNVLNGSIPAIFNDGCGCGGSKGATSDCSGVDATLQITPASFLGENDGSFTLTITGGTSTYSYSLVAPSGIVYLGNATVAGTSSTTHTFTGVISTSNGPGGIYTLTVEDANKCTRTFQVYMPAINNPEGCTNTAAFNYDPTATTDNNSCILCNAITNNLEIGGVDQGDFVTSQSTLITNTTTQVSADGSIEFVGGVHPQIAPFLTGATFELTIYPTTGNNQAPIVNGTETLVSGLSSPVHTFNNLATGWYAVKVKNSLTPTCLSWGYFYVDYGDVAVDCNDAVNIDFQVFDCGVWQAHVSTLLETNNSYYTINGFEPPEQNQSQIVSENDIITFTVVFGEETNCDPYTEIFSVGAINCPPPPPVEIPGCTDPTASNYNPLATVDDGFCSDIFIGCMDPTAANYTPFATVDDGSCVYGITGCTNPAATNYDPNATIADNSSCVYACTETAINGITVTGNIPTLSITGFAPSYTVTWVNNDTGASITTEDTPVGPTLVNGVYTVTVTDGNGCTEVDILGVNTTIVEGCMDIYADNYNQAANSSNDNCTYSFAPSPCTPSEIESTKTQLDKCLSVKLDMVFNMLKSGRLTLCKEKVAKVLVLLRYLLSRRDLGCVYNCADSLSPTYSETVQGESCGTQWSGGGATGESLVWDSTVTYLWGDVVQHPTSLDIYTMTYTQGAYTPGSDPETEAGLVFWEYCREPFGFTDTTNRLDAYIAFIQNECKDCGIPGFTPIPSDTEQNSSSSSNATEGGSNIEIDDENIEL